MQANGAAGPDVGLARTLLVSPPMPPTQMTVGICDTTTGRTSTRTFDRSPVLIGRGHWNALSLDSPAVAPLHGEIWFGPGFLAYLNLTSRRPTVLDGRLLRSGELVRVRGRPSLVIGPYHIDATPEPFGSGHEGASNDGVGKADYVTHALAVMANFASPLLELRRHLQLPASPPSVDPNEPYEIVRSLLMSSSPMPGPRRRSDA